MSQVVVTITTQPEDFAPWIRDTIELELRIGAQVYEMDLTLDPIGGYKKFKEIQFTSQAVTDNAQAVEYKNSINRDYAFLGQTLEPGVLTKSNIRASVNGNQVTITADTGTFHNGAKTGNALSSVTFSYNNTVQEAPKTFTYEKTGAGDCTNEQYRVLSATGGVPPYRLTLGGIDYVSDWDGVADVNFNLARTGTFNGGLYDSAATLIKSVYINPTKKLVASDFTVEVVPYTGYSDLKVVTLVARAGTTPLEYNLVDSGGAETGWQSSNIFGATPPGTYTLKVRDVYDCEVSKAVSVADITTPMETERVPYLGVSDFNSLSFYKETEFTDEVRSNYENTPSYMERVGLPKNGLFKFPVGSRIRTQFKSSYPFHAVTLHRAGASKVPLQFFLIQENLGVTEKVDCEVFRIQETLSLIDGGTVTISNGMGIYFNGGSQYEPNSTTLKADPDSPYTSGLPGWAQEVGNFVAIDGIGSFEIKETDLYDEDRGVTYFRVDGSFAEGTQKIQSSWDRHPYNVYRFDFDMSLVGTDGGFIRIEPGIMSGADFIVDRARVHASEWFTRITDTSKYIKVQWSAFRNIGEMLFKDGIQCEMWLKGRLRPFSQTESDTNDGDDRTRSVDQEAYLRMKGFFPLLSTRQWRKLDLVGSIGNRGKLLMEGLEVVRISSAELEEQGVSNLSNYTVDLAFAGESTAIAQEDPVYDIETGSTSTPGTGLEDVADWQAEGARLVSEDGSWIKVLDGDVEKYVDVT